MKRIGCLIAALSLLMTLSACRTGGEAEPTLRIGVALYQQEDTFIETVTRELQRVALEKEQAQNCKINLYIADGKESQTSQNEQVDRFLERGYDVICVNIVDRTAAAVIVDKAQAAGVPVIFFNREPVAEDMNRWEKLYYVGTDARESAVLEGQILVDAYRKNPSTLDRNGDGVVSYVLLEGETNHQDSLIRTEWSIETLKDGGVPIEKITGGIANWERNQASALMEQWLSDYGNKIELVLCNNDDMAIGAIDAIERAGIVAGTIKLVGIDGTPAGQEAFREGKLFGTVESSKDIYAKRIFDTAEELAMGKEVTQEKYFWCPQHIIAN